MSDDDSCMSDDGGVQLHPPPDSCASMELVDVEFAQAYDTGEVQDDKAREVFHQLASNLNTSDSPLWETPTDRMWAAGQSMAHLMITPYGKRYLTICRSLKKNWVCEPRDAIPDTFKNATPYSLALLGALRTFSGHTRGNREYAHDFLQDTWLARLWKSGYAQDPTAKEFVTTPCDLSGENQIQENIYGIMLVDVVNATQAFKTVALPDARPKIEPSARRIRQSAKKERRRQRKQERESKRKEEQLIANAEAKVANMLQKRPGRGKKTKAVGERKPEIPTTTNDLQPAFGQTELAGNSHGDVAPAGLSGQGAASRKRSRKLQSVAQGFAQFLNERLEKEMSPEEDHYAEFSKEDGKAYNSMAYMLDARLGVGSTQQKINKKKLKKLEAKLENGGRSEDHTSRLPTERFDFGSLGSLQAAKDEQEMTAALSAMHLIKMGQKPLPSKIDGASFDMQPGDGKWLPREAPKDVMEEDPEDAE